MHNHLNDSERSELRRRGNSMEHPYSTPLTNKYLCPLLFPFSLIISLVLFLSQSSYLPSPIKTVEFLSQSAVQVIDPCTGRYIYVYDLPEQFNSEILRDCRNISLWTDMCQLIINSGLGPKLDNTDGVLQETGWYLTDQWVLEIIFHNRMKQYKCLTTNYSMSSAVFIPYYPGLDVMRYLWDKSERKVRIDKLTFELIDWLKQRPEWVAKGGRDHFIVSGRTTWDLIRDEVNWWGSKLLKIPEVENMSVLSIERRPGDNNEYAIPYPTYFHPSTNSQVVAWQQKVRSQERPWLFSFAGGRRPNMPHMVRNHLIDQCSLSNKCKLHECKVGSHDCNSPSKLIKLFMQSKFCLQPPGDTRTRRSFFDTMLAGCIPVFFDDASARQQYKWHYPREFNSFSVFISEDTVKAGQVLVEDVLLQYSEEQIQLMREEVIKTIPHLVYKDPRYKSEDLEDAFDVAVDRVLNTVREKNAERKSY
jgi:xyloglucan galactosyltransferase MUR3